MVVNGSVISGTVEQTGENRGNTLKHDTDVDVGSSQSSCRVETNSMREIVRLNVMTPTEILRWRNGRKEHPNGAISVEWVVEITSCLTV